MNANQLRELAKQNGICCLNCDSCDTIPITNSGDNLLFCQNINFGLILKNPKPIFAPTLNARKGLKNEMRNWQRNIPYKIRG